MASDLLAIGRSGAQAARVALDVTAQNIANASTEGYVRRSVQLAEVSATGGFGRVGDVSLSGVRLDGLTRNADVFRQAEMRRTGADAARASAEVDGLQNIEDAVEHSGAYDAIVQFEGALQQLAADPVDPSLRASVIANARTLTGAMNLAARSLDAAGSALRFEAADGVAQVNTLAGELARVNLRLSRSADASSDQSTLLDQRDQLLARMSQYVDVTATIGADNTAQVRIGGAAGPQLVTLGSASPLAMTTNTDGTLSFTLGAGAVAPTGGAIVGKALALDKLKNVRGRLDTVAAAVMTTVNTAQMQGVGLDGAPGAALFTGANAADMALAFEDGAGIATAPAGAAAGSRDAGALTALRTALAGADPAGKMDALIFDISGAVQGRKVTLEALQSIAGAARTSLAAQAGVDLDNEAVNLLRFQQAFQASGRVMQVAADLFDTLLGIR